MTLGGSICMGSIIIGIYALPTSVYDFKKSSLLKRIGVTPVSPL
jgi:ABC-type multidrug transport system permease subunit